MSKKLIDKEVFDHMSRALRGVPAIALARAFNSVNPGVNWIGCSKTELVEALTTNSHTVFDRLMDAHGSMPNLSKYIRSEEEARRAKRQVERERKEKDERAWTATQKRMIDTATRMLEGKRVSKGDKDEMLRYAIPLMRARGFWV